MNTSLSIAAPTMQALKRSHSLLRIKANPPTPYGCGYLCSQSRSKSSTPLPSSPDTSPSAYDRALQNATAFDTHYNLLDNTSGNPTHPNNRQWLHRQVQITKQNPMKPYPLSPPKFIPPSPGYPPSFFPPYAHSGRVGPPSLPQDHVLIHDEESATRMRTAAKMARKLLDYACDPSIVTAGRTTEEIDSLVHDAALANGAYPSPLNYMGFPKSVCASINEVVCHGIPDSRPLKNGDVVSFDVSCYIGGVHGDNCATVVVGDCQQDPNDKGKLLDHSKKESSTEQYLDFIHKDWRSIPYRTNFSSAEEEERFVTARRLVQAALESRDEGVKACKPGGCLSDIGRAIHEVADAYGYDTVRHYRGHGISSDFHCAPFVKHFRNSDKMELLPGMIFTIEPMLTEVGAECIEWSDNWTVVTKDGGRAAQFEHTVLITESGVEILTAI